MPDDASFIPLVPYSSFEEYEQMLAHMTQAYCTMVEQSLRDTDKWYGWAGDVRWDIQERWLAAGDALFRTLTKGRGEDWGSTKNQMVIHALNTAARTLMASHALLGRTLGTTRADKAFVTALLKEEARLAIADDCMAPNNMCRFEERNFTWLHCAYASEESRYLPVAVVHDMKLAFAMLDHPRLGVAAGGRSLGADLIRLILSSKCF